MNKSNTLINENNTYNFLKEDSESTLKNLWKSNIQPTTNMQKIHLLGAGGCGMKSLKVWLDAQNYTISGTDDYKHEEWMIKGDPDADCLVVTSVIKKDHPQYIWALQNNKPVFHRASFVKYLLTSESIAISGTHGKTTTSGLTTWILHTAKLNPSFLLGDIIQNFNLSSKYAGEISVVESDESDGSMQKLTGKTNVITNIDKDHMDYYKNQTSLINAFKNFSEKSEKCIAHLSVKELLQKNDIVTYAIDQKADLYAMNIKATQNGMQFDLCGMYNYKNIHLNMPGIYNIENALAAILATAQYNIYELDLRESLLTFKGMKKRMEKHIYNGIDCILDYAHHPHAVKLALDAIMMQNHANIHIVLEVHKYSRLRNHMQEFVNSISKVQNIALLPTFKAGEEIDHILENKFHQRIKEKSDLTLVNSAHQTHEFINKVAKKGDAVMFIGAGAICPLFYDVIKSC